MFGFEMVKDEEQDVCLSCGIFNTGSVESSLGEEGASPEYENYAVWYSIYVSKCADDTCKLTKMNESKFGRLVSKAS